MVQKDRWATRILESARDAILIMDAGGLVLQANDAADTLLGLTRARLVGSRLPDLLTAGAAPPAGGSGRPSPATPSAGPFEVELTTIDCTGHPALHAAFLRELPPAPAAPDPDHARLGLDGRSLDGTFSDEFFPVLGVGNGAGPLGSDTIRGLIHPAEGQAVRELLAALKRQPGRTARAGIETETRLQRPDGTMREIRLRGRVDRDETGRTGLRGRGGAGRERAAQQRAPPRGAGGPDARAGRLAEPRGRRGRPAAPVRQRARAARRIAVDLVGAGGAPRVPRDVERPRA